MANKAKEIITLNSILEYDLVSTETNYQTKTIDLLYCNRETKDKKQPIMLPVKISLTALTERPLNPILMGVLADIFIKEKEAANDQRNLYK